MNSSEFGNVSWVYYVVGAYAVVMLSLAVMALSSLRRFRLARRALNEEGFSDDRS
jgi:heme exporter protein D